MVLHKLHAGGEVSLVELVGDVPSEWSKHPPLLDGGVQEGHCVQRWPPLRGAGVVKLLLGHSSVRPLQPRLHPLRRLVGELDTGLEGGGGGGIQA